MLPIPAALSQSIEEKTTSGPALVEPPRLAPDNRSFPVRIVDGDEKSRGRHKVRQEILALARAGDFVSVQRRVATSVEDRRSRRSLDVDLADELAAVSFNLDETGDAEAALRISELAREALTRVKQAGQGDEAIWANFVEATLWERVYRDPTKARAAYKNVLKLDPENQAARDALARLDLADAITAEKIKEQEQLLDEQAALSHQPR
jgi:hypothetical protein